MHCPLPHEEENSLRKNLQTSLCHKVSIRVTVVFFKAPESQSSLLHHCHKSQYQRHFPVLQHEAHKSIVTSMQITFQEFLQASLSAHRSYHTSTEHSTMTRPHNSQIRITRPGVRHYNCLAIFFPRNNCVGSDHCM